MTQAKAARKLGVSLYKYRKWEESGEQPPAEVLPNLEELRDYEVYVVNRLRAKFTVAETAQRVGCSRWWLRQMEMGEAPANKLAKYWGE